MTMPYGEDSRVTDLIRTDERIWDMGMRLADISVVMITTDGRGEIITDGPLPTPTNDFTRMAGFEYVRRGGHLTSEVDAFTIAKAALAVRCWPMEELIRIKAMPSVAPVDETIEPTGNGPVASGPFGIIPESG